jgi:hypothetical protein
VLAGSGGKSAFQSHPAHVLWEVMRDAAIRDVKTGYTDGTNTGHGQFSPSN